MYALRWADWALLYDFLEEFHKSFASLFLVVLLHLVPLYPCCQSGIFENIAVRIRAENDPS